jgi:hypothetical protein
MEEILPMTSLNIWTGTQSSVYSLLTLRITAFETGIMHLLISSIPKRFINPLTGASRFMELKCVEG